MPAQKTAFTVSQRVGGSTHLSEIGIGPDMKLADQIQIIVQHIIKIPAFLSGLCQNHGEMEGNGTNIEPSHKNRHICIIRRMHAAPLIPG